MDSVFLEDMERNKSFFSPIKSNLTKIIQKSDEILQNKEENLVSSPAHPWWQSFTPTINRTLLMKRSEQWQMR
jgi:hypothetical protein